jgi:ParB family chromosome partitioning protein
MIPVTLLAPHPGNQRKDLKISPAFLASISGAGVVVPLRVTSREDGEDGFWVIDGHRRLSAAVTAGLEEVPCDLAADRTGDLAGQYLDMVTTSRHREQLRPIEEADALFAAHQAGASRTRIRRNAGLTPGEVTAALTAGKLTGPARDAATARDLTLDELVILAEFDSDEAAVIRLTRAAVTGRIEYEAELIRAERADLAEEQRLSAELAAAGVAASDSLPAGAALLTSLRDGDAELTPGSHAGCPGHAAWLRSWAPTTAAWYCADPDTHGHTPLWQQVPPAGPAGTDDASGGAGQDRDARRLVLSGNRAWKAAGEVRRRWLVTVLSRRTAPAEVTRFLAGQLILVPEPLHSGLAQAWSRSLFTDLAGGRTAQDLAGAASTCPPGQLPLLMLVPVAAAYEQAMTEGEQAKATWREGRFSPCPRDRAGQWLTFLASLGYQLSGIEQAVADGTAWAGDDTPGTGTAGGSSPAAGDGQPGTDGESSPADARDAGQAAA